MEKMKILHVISDLRPDAGGPPKAALEMCQGLAREGHEVSLYTTDHEQKGSSRVKTNEIFEDEGVRIYIFSSSLIGRWPVSLGLAKSVRKTIRNFDIVEIHSLYLFHSMITAYYCRKYSIPYVIRPHGSLDPFLRKKGKLKKAIYHFLVEDRNLNNAAAIHYTAEDEKELVHSPLGYKSQAMVVPLGLNLQDYDALPERGCFRSQHQELFEKPIILFLGRITPKKGIDLLAKAFGLVARIYPDSRLVIVGPEDNGFGDQVRQWLAESDMLNKTIFTGMLRGQEKLAAFVDADLFVLPSYTENFGIALVEAMACGLPVITSNKVNICQEIQQFDAGIVINCDAGELAKAIIVLLENVEIRKEYGTNGRRLVEQKFNWKIVAGQLSKEYQNILQNKL
jgi:glycosyltransferase involved in cell wall biosynthesis